MGWRIATLLALAIALPAVAQAATDDDPIAVLESRLQDDWRRFAQRYLMDDGRIIDTGNGNISHSEGQGYGMLFAVAAGDRENFERIRAWTQTVLRRDDELHFWRYDPRSSPTIADPNSAADGELLIAWALLRAARLWQEERYLVEARLIINAVEHRLIRRIGRRLVIVPWDLADLDSPRVINLSYFIFPAMQDIAVERQSGLWVELYEDSLELVQDARFGFWQLPPDWLAIDDDNRLQVWSEREPRFSYDAIRVPLHLAWAGHDTREFLGPFVDAWSQFGPRRGPEWFGLSQNRNHAGTGAPVGFRAVRTLTESLFRTVDQGRADRQPLPTVYDTRDYYSASLVLLCRLAEIDWWRNQPVAAPEPG